MPDLKLIDLWIFKVNLQKRCDISICEFSSPINLIHHKIIYWRDNLFSRHACETSFTSSNSFNVHRRIQKEEKNLWSWCDDCEKYFTQSTNLNRQMNPPTRPQLWKYLLNTCRSFCCSSLIYVISNPVSQIYRSFILPRNIISW